jgi:hypothetical protein
MSLSCLVELQGTAAENQLTAGFVVTLITYAVMRSSYQPGLVIQGNPLQGFRQQAKPRGGACRRGDSAPQA